MNTVKTLCGLVFAISLAAASGCASNSEAVAQKRAAIEDLSLNIDSSIYLSFAGNVGLKLLCKEPNYLQCLDVAPEQCVGDLKGLLSNCVDTVITDSAVTTVTTKAEGEQLAQSLGVCLAAQHLDRQVDRLTPGNLQACAKLGTLRQAAYR